MKRLLKGVFLNKLLSKLHKNFIRDVKSGRGARLKGDRNTLFSGLFWNGQQAQVLGLIDDLANVYRVAADVVGVETQVNYTQQDKFERWFSLLESLLRIEPASNLTATPLLR